MNEVQERYMKTGRRSNQEQDANQIQKNKDFLNEYKRIKKSININDNDADFSMIDTTTDIKIKEKKYLKETDENYTKIMSKENRRISKANKRYEKEKLRLEKKGIDSFYRGQ